MTISPQGAIDAGAQVASCGDEHMAEQWDHGDRDSGGSAYGRVQRCSGLDEASQSDGDDQRWSDDHCNRDLYAAAGSLQVTISPQGAIDAGAQWRRVGTSTWRNSGTTETGIPVGQHTVEFSDVAGWTKPGNQTVTISNGQTTTAHRDLYAADRFLAGDDQSPGGD